MSDDVDSHLVALSADTGRVIWDVEVSDYKMAHSVTVAPLALENKIIVGIAGGEYGIRGFLDAYHPRTGERLWRFWTVCLVGFVVDISSTHRVVYFTVFF